MKFNDLSIQEKAAVIKLGVGSGLRSLQEIQQFWDGMPEDPPVIQKVNKSQADFVQRLKDPNREYIRDWENPDNIATHKMSWADDGVVYPQVQNVNGKLVDFSRPPYSTWAGYDNAVRNGDTIHMTPEEAEWFTTHYKDYYPGFDEYKKGGSIHIKPENRGKFTALKKRTGHSASWFKAHGTPAQRKMATFALNARKWHKHAYGGPGDGLDTYMTQEQIDNARYIWNYITGQGISPRNAAVLMGNAMKESSLNPQAKNPNSSAFGYLQMIDAQRKKADKYIRQNNLDKDLGQFDYYNYLIQNNIDDYMKEYNRVYNEMNRRQQVYNSNPTENNKINLQEYIDHYNKMYGKRVSENRLFPVSDLKEAYNNPKSTVKELTPLFEETFMKSNSGAEHDKRVKYAYDFLDYFAPDERAYEVMRNDPLNYDSKGNYILEDGAYNYALGGPIKPFSYLPIPEVRY